MATIQSGLIYSRLLGGSHHGKKIPINDRQTQIFMQKKVKSKWNPLNTIDIDRVAPMDFEIYEHQTMRDVVAVGVNKYHVTVKEAYVKKGSKIKPKTFWKLASYVEEFMAWQI